jgi:protein-disulfide isomerase
MSSRQQQKEKARAERQARERADAQAQQRRRRVQQLGAVLAVAVVVVVVLVLVSQGGKDKPNASNGGAVAGASDARAMLAGIAQKGTSLGDPNAPVVMTEFADLQCPFCKQYTLDVLPTVVQNYVRTKKLRLEIRIRNFLGPDSDVAARAANAAATRNRLWNFIDVFYRNQGTEDSGYVKPAFLRRIATAAGVSPQLVVDGSTSAVYEKPVKVAESEATSAGLTSTPSFLIGPKGGKAKPLSFSALTVDAFTQAIDPQIKALAQ